jgi:uncharacterized integral membrane protein
MQGIKRIFLMAIALLIALVTLVFILENQQPVGLVFFGWSAPALPVSVYIACAFLLGFLLMPLFGWFRLGRLRFRLAAQQRELQACRKRLAELATPQEADQH